MDLKVDLRGLSLAGYPGQLTITPLADGRELSAGEVVERAFTEFCVANQARNLKVSELAAEWNALTDGERVIFITECVDDWNSGLKAGAAAVDAKQDRDMGLTAKAEELLGDAIIGCTLAELRALRRPWQELTSDQQFEVLERVTAQAKAAVAHTMRLLATRGARHVVCELESITVKKGCKATLEIPKGEMAEDLLEAVGNSVILVVGAMDAVGEVVAPDPEPDQRELLPPDALAVHSDPED